MEHCFGKVVWDPHEEQIGTGCQQNCHKDFERNLGAACKQDSEETVSGRMRSTHLCQMVAGITADVFVTRLHARSC